MSKREVSYIISVSDRASAGFRKVAEGSRKARREVEGLESAAEDAGDAIEEAFDGDAVEGLSEELDKARRKTRQLGEEAKESGRGFGGMAKEAKNFVKVLAAAEVTKFFVKQGKEAVNAAAQMETYQATLETMLGSTDAARDRIEEYKDVAKVTPFGMSDVVEAGNQLQAIGRYSRQNLEMLGDLAAATNKPMEQVMNAYAKLATGQKGEASRMFQDLLITRDDWVAATGKGVSKSGELLASTEEMLLSLPKIIAKKGYGGMMAKQAETANGKFSNLKDSVFSLRVALGERMMPTVKNVVGGLTRMVNSMERAVRVPLAEKITHEKVELNLLVGQLMDANTREERRAEIIDELQSKYPDFLKNVNLEKDGTKGLREELEKVNAEYDRKIKKAHAMENMEAAREDYKDVLGEIANAEMADFALKKMKEIEKKQGLKDGNARAQLIGAEKDDEGWYLTYRTFSKRGMYGPNKTVRLPNMTDEMMMEYKDWESIWRKNAKTDAEKKKLSERASEYKRIEKMWADYGGIDLESGNNGTTGGEGVNENPDGAKPDDKKTNPDGTDDGTPPGMTTPSYGMGAGSGSGGGSGKTVTTNIGTLVGTIEIHTTTLQEGAAEVKRLVTQALLEAVPSDL